MKFAYLIWSNLRRRKLRTALTALSILVAFVLFGYLSAIGRGLSQEVSVEGANRLMVRHRVSLTQPLPLSYQARIAQIPGVAQVTHATWFGGIYQDSRSFFAQMPVVPAEWLEMHPEMRLPEAQKRAWMQTRTGAIAGRKLADRFGWKVGDRIPLQATIWRKEDGSRTWEFDLAGIFDGKDKNTDTSQFFFRYDYFDESRAFGKGLVGWYVVRVQDPSQAAVVAERIDHEFANSPAETKAETEGAFVRGFAKQIGDIGAIVRAILAAVFFTILLVAGNTMAQAVRERTEELGLLKALGYSNQQVLVLVLLESCFLAAVGGLAGLGLAWLLISAGDPTRGSLPVFYFPARDVIAGVLLVFALGMAAGLFPALQAMRLSIAEALRRT
jgi:putative ABC transport system permease protein